MSRVGLRWFVGLSSIVLVFAVASALGATATIPKKVVYTSQGTIVLATLQPGHQQRYVLVSENVATDPLQRERRDRLYMGEDARLRFVRLDLETGQTTLIKEFDPPAPSLLSFDQVVSYAKDGRVATFETNKRPFALQVIETDGTVRSLGRPDADILWTPTWHPDSEHLLFIEVRWPKGGRPVGQDVFAAVPPDGPLTVMENAISNIGGGPIRWTNDGRFIFFAREMGEHTVALLRASYPSLAVTAMASWEVDTIWTSRPFFLWAETSEDIVWLSYRSKGKGRGKTEVWRLAPGQDPKRTALTLSATPRQAALSPDGKSLALVTKAGKVYVADLDGGAKVLRPGVSVAENELPIQWALGGKALLTSAEGRTRLVLIPVGRD